MKINLENKKENNVENVNYYLLLNLLLKTWIRIEFGAIIIKAYQCFQTRRVIANSIRYSQLSYAISPLRVLSPHEECGNHIIMV